MAWAGSNMVASIGSWCARNKWVVVILWILLLAGVTIGGKLAGGTLNAPFTVPGTSSQNGADIATKAFPQTSGLQMGQVVVYGSADVMKSTSSQSVIESAIKDVKTLPGMATVSDPFTQAGSVSGDASTAVINIGYDVSSEEISDTTFKHLQDAMSPVAKTKGLKVAYLGAPAAQAGSPPIEISEELGLLAAVIVLLVTFMAVLAMIAPLISAMVGLILGIGFITLSSSFLSMTAIAPTLATMIGLGVGIDYAVFIVSRHRELLRTGSDVPTALRSALASSGRSVLVAGATVTIALLGLFVSGIPVVSMLGVAAAIAVVTAVLAALTLLPALLGIFGRRIMRPRDRKLPPLSEAENAEITHGVWGVWARFVGSHPVPFLVLAVAIMGTLAIPTLSMDLGEVDSGSDPPGSTTRIAYDQLSDAFGVGINGPVQLVLTPYADQAGAEQVVTALKKDKGVASVQAPAINAKQKVTMIQLIPSTSPTSNATEELLGRLPGDVEAVTGKSVTVDVTGVTAGMSDLSNRIVERLPYLIGAVLLLSFILLLVEFRSLMVPLSAVVMNILSVGAAYGVIVAVFQWGWGAELIGVPERVEIVAYVPMMMFAILFGLSMDYEIFLISRIRESHLSGVSTLQSIEVGLSHTARVITAAALVMITVFLAFVLVDNVVIKMFGLGLAVAVLVDSTIVRMMLVPSTMVLLGRTNWWLPGWLRRVLPGHD